MLIRVADQLVEYIQMWAYVASKISLHCLLNKLLLVHGANSRPKLTDSLTARKVSPVNKVS